MTESSRLADALERMALLGWAADSDKDAREAAALLRAQEKVVEAAKHVDWWSQNSDQRGAHAATLADLQIALAALTEKEREP